MFNSSKSWNVPHELINAADLHGVEGREQSLRQRSKEAMHLEGSDCLPGMVALHVETYESSDPSRPLRDPCNHSVNGSSVNKSIHQKVPQKRRKRLPDYVTFSKSSARTFSLPSLVSSDAELEKKRDSLERETSNSKSGKVEELRKKLAFYSMFGLPRLSRDMRMFWEIREGNETSIRLENSWRDIIQGHETMSRKCSHQQEAIWELLYTELSYMKRLRVITDLFICGLLNLHNAGFLNEMHPELLFSNIPEIIRAHRSFWQEVMSPALEHSRRTGQKFNPLRFKEGFLAFSIHFDSYVTYCLEVKKKMEFVRHEFSDNELFKLFVSWVEKHKQSHRLLLSDMLMKPHQRITKYPLLLKAILKRTEDSQGRDALTSMISSVEMFLQYINAQMQHGEDYEKLLFTLGRIGSYEVLEPASEEIEKNLKPFSRLDLTVPVTGAGPQCVRCLLKEGSLKMKEGKEGKLDVHCFLFIDVFLITKMQKKSELSKVIRPPLLAERIVCRALRDPNSFLLIYLNEFRCASVALSFQCSNPSSCKDWIQKILKAQDTLKNLKSEESLRHEKEIQALYMSIDPQSRPSPSSSPILSHQNDDSTEDMGSHSEFSTVLPELVITDDTIAPDLEDEASDIGFRRKESSLEEQRYGNLMDGNQALFPHIANMEHTSRTSLLFPELQRQKRHRLGLKQEPRMALSALDLRSMLTSDPSSQLEPSAVSHHDSVFWSSMPDMGSFMELREASPFSDTEEESLDSGSTDHFPISNIPRGSLVVETLQRAKIMEKQWRKGSAKDYSDSTSDLSGTEELEFVKSRAHISTDEEGWVHRISGEEDLGQDTLEEHLFSNLSLTNNKEEEEPLPQSKNILRDRNGSDFPVHVRNMPLSQNTTTNSPPSSERLWTNLQPPKGPQIHAENYEGPLSPWLLTIQVESELYKTLSPRTLKVEDILMKRREVCASTIPVQFQERQGYTATSAPFTSRKLTQKELRRLRSIHLKCTTSVSEV
ncbi:pleckstrin homology domain-containing family G member 6 [Rhinatrema bivittatum]|uniref:pleckstrin homology domain-containing family G member 6 n=1 Tax=Rhinatrema bivittatum TaxID=194408 RepID=UPI00112934D5|nr:pleckstrin homology domain-containing family G member 6 [Rhinatrema bivittatum]